MHKTTHKFKNSFESPSGSLNRRAFPREEAGYHLLLHRMQWSMSSCCTECSGQCVLELWIPGENTDTYMLKSDAAIWGVFLVVCLWCSFKSKGFFSQISLRSSRALFVAEMWQSSGSGLQMHKPPPQQILIHVCIHTSWPWLILRYHISCQYYRY